LAYFSALENGCQNTTFTTHPTTFSPAKTIPNQPLFPKTPSKTQETAQITSPPATLIFFAKKDA
jgi:hypothetical protein